MVRKISVALSFLTIIPVNVGTFRHPRELSDAAVYFPLVGGLFGSVFAVVAYFSLALLPPGPVVVLLFIGAFLFTRGLHVDGLADTADGLLGGMKKEGALAIMRDSAVGPLGAAAVLLLYLFKYAAITTAGEEFITLLFFAMPVCGRWSMVLAGAFYPPAREGGLGFQFISGMGRCHFLKASFWGCILLAAGPVLLGVKFIFPVLAGAVAAFAMALFLPFLSVRSLGGITGDILGAVNETAEATFILGAVLWLGLSTPIY
ncbi:MAG: adenosylcobinamide-GDP ribazoletransferase [Bacillota bacterium]